MNDIQPPPEAAARTRFDDLFDQGPDYEAWAQDVITAFHEAGHAVVGHVLGETPAAVSIQPTAHYLGVAVYDVDGRPGHPEHVEDAPLVGDMACRTWIERELLITKAGSQAEALLHDMPVQRIAPRPSDVQAEQRLTTALSSLSSRAIELLRASAVTPVVDDWTQATRLSEHLAGSEARAHGVWMSAVARRLVHDNWPAIERVARVLLDEQVMSGGRVADVCAKETA